jgi:hypothetical protein
MPGDGATDGWGRRAGTRGGDDGRAVAGRRGVRRRNRGLTEGLGDGDVGDGEIEVAAVEGGRRCEGRWRGEEGGSFSLLHSEGKGGFGVFVARERVVDDDVTAMFLRAGGEACLRLLRSSSELKDVRGKDEGCDELLLATVRLDSVRLELRQLLL